MICFFHSGVTIAGPNGIVLGGPSANSSIENKFRKVLSRVANDVWVQGLGVCNALFGE